MSNLRRVPTLGGTKDIPKFGSDRQQRRRNTKTSYTTVAFLEITRPNKQSGAIEDLGTVGGGQLYRLKGDASPGATHKALLDAGFEPVDYVGDLFDKDS